MPKKNKTWEEMFNYIQNHINNLCKKPWTSTETYGWCNTDVICHQVTLDIPQMPTRSAEDAFQEAKLLFWYCPDPIELGNENCSKKMPLLQLRFVTRKRAQKWHWSSGIHEKDGDYDLNISYLTQDDTTQYSSQQWDLVVPAPYTKREEECVDEFMRIVQTAYAEISEQIISQRDSFEFGEECRRQWANAIHRKQPGKTYGKYKVK